MEFDLRIVSTFDASRGCRGDDFLPTYAAQLAAANTIVLTKLDRSNARESSEAGDSANGFNPLARQIVELDRAVRARSAFEGGMWGKPSRRSEFAAIAVASPRIKIGFGRWPSATRWEDIGEWIENVSGYFGDRLLRMKGLVRPYGAESALLINGVGGVFATPRSIAVENDDELGLIMIARDIEPDEFATAAGTTDGPEVSFR